MAQFRSSFCRPGSVSNSFSAVVPIKTQFEMETFQSDCAGKRCTSGERSGDVFNDYLDKLNGVISDDSMVTWKLDHVATLTDYESWESIMLQGFRRCNTWKYVDHPTRVFLTLRRVDKEIARLWTKERHGKYGTYGLWHDFTKFLRAYFMSQIGRASCRERV